MIPALLALAFAPVLQDPAPPPPELAAPTRFDLRAAPPDGSLGAVFQHDDAWLVDLGDGPADKRFKRPNGSAAGGVVG